MEHSWRAVPNNQISNKRPGRVLKNTKDNSLKIITQPVVILSKFGSQKLSLSRFKIGKQDDLFCWNIIYSDMIISLEFIYSQNAVITEWQTVSAATSRLQCLFSLFRILLTHKGISFNNLSSRVCLWTLIINSHKIFSSIAIDPLIETSLICSLLLDIFPPLSRLCLFHSLTGCADFGSLLFSTNPLPDFPPSQIYMDFRGNAVIYQTAVPRLQHVIQFLKWSHP